MEEKIKISLKKSTLDLLKKDCEDFKITKADGSPNMNLFINGLIVNYYEEFSASEEGLHDEIKNALFYVPEAYKKKALDEVLKVIARRTSHTATDKSSATLSFKPTKSSERAIAYIENVALKNEALSSFYRRLLLAYSQKPKNEREKIIFKDNYEILCKAIQKGVQVCITLKSNDKSYENMSLYSVSSSKDELFNYVLCYSRKNNHTLRLASIKNVYLLPDRSQIPEENKNLFKRQVECGAQHPMYPSDDTPIKVQLTEKGKELFKRIYLYRPTPVSIEDNIYTFNCSANQLLYYFERFGENALILSPKRLGIFMRNYYHFALKKYRTVYGKD
ncbi:MAG: WYL domain-containing protein [Clostridia bacterium]|nr:WYL domain-containing protein [Clostridia bacterium]